jgi:hypothetical protein
LIKVGLIQQVFFVALVVDLMLKNGFRPPKASRRPQIELALQGVFAARKNDEIFRPADFSNQRLEFCKIFIISLFIIILGQLSSKPSPLAQADQVSDKPCLKRISVNIDLLNNCSE